MPVRPEFDCDVMIVGGGLVGATLACALRANASGPLEVMLVEAAPVSPRGPARQPCFDSRSTALALGSVEYLRELGLWEGLAGHVTPIQRIHVSDRGRFGAVRMDHAEQGVEALGYVAENAALGRALNQALHQLPGIILRGETRVLDLEAGEAGVRVALQGPRGREELRAALVVLAEGGRSGLGEKLGIWRRTEGYGQSALIANVCFSTPHSNIAFERFTPEGPLALLPLEDFEEQPRAALIWTQPEEAAASLLALDDAAFLRRLQAAFGRRLGAFTRAGERMVYPLSLVRAQEQCRPGLVLLGNAANTLHPVAGQGFNLALRNAMALAGRLLEARAQGESPGAISVLRGYAEEVERDQNVTVAFSDNLIRLFSNGSLPLALTRQAGLLGIELIAPIKRALVLRAMGRGGRRARLHDPRHG